MNTIKPICVKKSKIAQTLFTLASCMSASCLAITTIFNANLLKRSLSRSTKYISIAATLEFQIPDFSQKSGILFSYDLANLVFTIICTTSAILYLASHPNWILALRGLPLPTAKSVGLNRLLSTTT